jgi:hypothetical protein
MASIHPSIPAIMQYHFHSPPGRVSRNKKRAELATFVEGLLSFPASLFTPWPPGAKGIIIKIVRDYASRGLKSQNPYYN